MKAVYLPRASADNNTARTMAEQEALVFSIIIVLILLILLVCTAFRLLCSTKGQIAGYWTSSKGDFFEICQLDSPPPIPSGPQKGEYAVSTASGFLGAATDGVYPVTTKGCRTVSIPFPNGELRGRVGLDRRRIIWDRAPTWYRQGL